VTADTGATRILVVEDEDAISEPLMGALAREGFEATVARTGREALSLAEQVRPHVVLLDLMLPDADGRDVCRDLRRRSDVAIVMLTARGTETDRIVGLELGADDYVVKPFSSAELIARVRAILRRSAARREDAPVAVRSASSRSTRPRDGWRSPGTRWTSPARSSICWRGLCATRATSCAGRT